MKDRHDGDCTIYSSPMNGNITDGICTCGFGLERRRYGDVTKMFSNERLNAVSTLGLTPPTAWAS